MTSVERHTLKKFKKNETKHRTAKQKIPRASGVFFILSDSLYNKFMERKRVGIVRGGKGKEYLSSIHKGGYIILHI
jgi:hypothetical protein